MSPEPELPFGTTITAPPATGRATDPLTSHQAAESIPADVLNTRCRMALAAMAHLGGRATADDVRGYWEDRLDKRQERSSWARRQTDLRDLGLIEDTGERTRSDTGRPCTVWQVTAAGYRVLGPKETW